MPLATGTRLGSYEILAPLGAGGMGEVYRAADPRLGRDVAIKVLPERFANDPDRLRRFETEARAAAAIGHPAIVAVYDVGVANGSPFLVTELLLGSNLRELLNQGRLPLARGLEIARAVLEGLAEAHARGIVHRDLKPENVFVTRDQRVKLLDFGLAKLAQPAGDSAPGGSAAETQTGQVLGTAGYMAPEQVRGETVDHRADLFAAGAMLYELLTGTRAFGARDGSAVDTLHAILHVDPPPPSSRAPVVPPAFDAIVARCLAKDPERRFQSAKDLLFALSLASDLPPAGSPRAGASGVARWRVASIVVAAAALAGWALLAKRSQPTVASMWAGGTLTPLTVDPGYEGQGTLSPDGETVAYASDRSGNFEIYLQQVGGGAPINLTDNAADDVQPAFSPDGKQLAFVSSRTSRLDLIYRAPGVPLMGGDVWVMPSLGGMARRVVSEGNFPTWSPDGKTIYFIRARWFFPELHKVDATGGQSVEIPVQLPAGFEASNFQQVRVSPDGRRLLFLAADEVLTIPVEGGRATRVAVARAAAWDVSGRAILFSNSSPGRNQGLWRIPLSRSGAPEGPAEPLLVGASGYDMVEMSRSGRRMVLTTSEVTGNLEELPLDAEAGVAENTPRRLTDGHNDVTFFTASPDGRSQIYTNARGAAEHLWRHEEGRDPVQLTTDSQWSESYPRWSPDGNTVAFLRRPEGTARVADEELWVMAPDGGSQHRLTEQGGNMAWLSGGRLLYFTRGSLHVIDVATGKDQPFAVRGPAPMPIFAVSPDSKWVVYQSSVKDKGVDIAVASIPGGEGRWLVTDEKEDYHPSFSPSGKWVYFQKDHRNLWRIPGPEQGWRQAPAQQVTFMNEPGLFFEDPQVCADGKRLFYSKVQTLADVWIVDAADARRP